MEESKMKEMDCVEVINEKERYTKRGIHKGMQGWICDPRSIDGTWLVNFPQYGEKDDIATLDIKEEDLRLLPDGMDARINEKIKTQFDNSGDTAKGFTERPDDLSGDLI